MNVLLTAINAKYIHSNPAVYSLRAYACRYGDSRYGEEIRIAEYTINQPFDEILMDIYKKHPDILCISCYLWNISCVEQLITEIPKILPDTKIWLGGPEVSYNGKEMLQTFPGLAGIMCGEGEKTLLELMEYYETGHGVSTNIQTHRKALGDIDGIIYRENDSSHETICQTAAREPLDLNEIPFIYEHIEDFENRIVYYESSRGCPFSCSYCLSSIDKCLRFRDIGLVQRELQFFIEHKVPQIKFVDRTFNCRHDHAMAVWTYIKEHDRGITNFHFEVAADLLNGEEIELIRSMRPGLIQLEIGVQSTNADTVREIRRKMDLEKVERNTAAVRKLRNVHQHLDLIAGLPFEDYSSFARSFDRVYSMKPDQLQLGFLKVLKGSHMHEKAQEYGLVYQSRPPYEVLSTKWLSYRDVIQLKKIEEMVEIYYNSEQFRYTMERLEQEFVSPFEMYSTLAGYYEENGLFEVSHSRIARYEILNRFLKKYMGENSAEYGEWLTLDLYLRDNVKNRPAFLPENRVQPDRAAAFYKSEEKERRYLTDYAGYDRRQMRKMTHLEEIRGEILLFDYRHRNPLNGDAAVYTVKIPEKEINYEFS